MEEDDIVKSMAIASYGERERERERRTDEEGKGCKPKGAYKKVPRASRRPALAAAKRSLIYIVSPILKVLPP